MRGAQYRDQGVTLQLVQERSGNYKPLYRAFPHKDGLSTVPILMQGHPDDVKGGRLISSEVRHILEPCPAGPARSTSLNHPPLPHPRQHEISLVDRARALALWLDPDPDP